MLQALKTALQHEGMGKLVSDRVQCLALFICLFLGLSCGYVSATASAVFL